MKISVLLEGELGQLKSDLTLYLARMKANSIFTIDTDVLVREMESLGHAVTPEAMIDILNRNKYVSSANTDTITVKGGDVSTGGGSNDKEKNKKTVRKLATKAARKGLK